MLKTTRPEVLQQGPMHYAPTNEMGVVFLFSHIAARFGVRVEEIRSQYPDCIAYMKIGGAEKRIQIEFEYRSSNFRTHGHQPKQCDWIVCWEHDWPDAPERIRVVELCKEFGHGFNVWIQPVIKSQWEELKYDVMDWGLSKRAHDGDLLLMYRCYPDSKIEDIFTLAGSLSRGKAGWRQGDCFHGQVRRISKLTTPILLKELRSDRHLRSASFVRRNMQGNLKVTEYWPELYRMIISRNPAASSQLVSFI